MRSNKKIEDHHLKKELNILVNNELLEKHQPQKEFNILVNNKLLKESNAELVKIKRDECSFYNVEIILAIRMFDKRVGYWVLLSEDIKKIKKEKHEMEIDHEYYYYLKEFYLIKLIENKKK